MISYSMMPTLVYRKKHNTTNITKNDIFVLFQAKCGELVKMSKLISFDFAIKYLLKDKGNYDIIEGFISALLKERGYKPVKIIALLDTESNKEEYNQKKSLADLIVEDENHNKYIVEIERQKSQHFIHKSCFNTSRLIVDQISSGVDY